jgi:hypothetical protein
VDVAIREREAAWRGRNLIIRRPQDVFAIAYSRLATSMLK